MERESSLERSRAQLEVDWQRQCEDTEREVYMKQEQLVAGLTKQRDQVIINIIVMIKAKKKLITGSDHKKVLKLKYGHF